MTACEGECVDLSSSDEHCGACGHECKEPWFLGHCPESFFLEPVQRELQPGPHVLEVRHSGGAPQRYSLTVLVLPDAACPA